MCACVRAPAPVCVCVCERECVCVCVSMPEEHRGVCVCPEEQRCVCACPEEQRCVRVCACFQRSRGSNKRVHATWKCSRCAYWCEDTRIHTTHHDTLIHTHTLTKTRWRDKTPRQDGKTRHQDKTPRQDSGNLCRSKTCALCAVCTKCDRSSLEMQAGPTGHILNLGHGVLVGTPEENVKAFFDAAKKIRY